MAHRPLWGKKTDLSILKTLGVEHGQLNDVRLHDPKFERFYQTHKGHFLDVIETSYLQKLVDGRISKDDFVHAMANYVSSHHSGSQGPQRNLEARHITKHVSAMLAFFRQMRKRKPPETVSARGIMDWAYGLEGQHSQLAKALRDVLDKPDRKDAPRKN